MPYWRLSSVYFFYFASLGALIPYFGLYLHSLGFLAAQVGLVFAVIQGTKLVAPSLIAGLSARFDNRMHLVQLAALLTVLSFSFLLIEQTFYWVLVITFIFSFFWNAMLPQFESITLTKLGVNTHAYSDIRLWGSLGFIATVAGTGFILDIVDLSLWPWLVSLCLMAILLSSLSLQEKQIKLQPDKNNSIISIVKQKKVIVFFMVVFLVQASHGPYYVFYSILLDSLGYNETQIGQFWALGVVAEIVLFILIKHVFKRVSLRFVMLISVFLTMIRWLIIGWLSSSLAALLIAQLLHAASFGSFHVVCIHLTHLYFKGHQQDKGQAFYSSVGYGAGGMLGVFVAGLLWDDLGEEGAFTAAFLMSLIALCLCWKWVEREGNKPLKVEADEFNPL